MEVVISLGLSGWSRRRGISQGVWCVQSFSCLSRALHASFTARSSCCLNYSMDTTKRVMKRKQHSANFPLPCSLRISAVCWVGASPPPAAWGLLRRASSRFLRVPSGAELPILVPVPQRPAAASARPPRAAGLLSASFPSALRFVPFFFSCAVAMTEYGNMFMNLLHQSQPCDKAISL